MSYRLKLESWLHARREAWRAAFVRGPFTGFVFEFVSFGIKQGWACLFGGLMLAVLLGSYLIYPEGAALPRYDFITLAALAFRPPCSRHGWRRGKKRASSSCSTWSAR